MTPPHAPAPVDPIDPGGAPDARAGLSVVVAVSAFVALIGLAAQRYPGGTWADPGAAGHSFFGNFFCDLTLPTALSGEPNASAARLATAGMVVLALGLVPFWWLLGGEFAQRGVRRLVRAAGTGGAAATALVPLLPSSSFGRVHAAAVLCGAALGLAACLGSVAGLLLARPRRWGLLGLVGGSLSCGVVDAWLYVLHLRGAPFTVWMPALQKIAAALLLAWMLAVAWPYARAVRRKGDAA